MMSWWEDLYNEWIGKLPPGTVRCLEEQDKTWVSIGDLVADVAGRLRQEQNNNEAEEKEP